jgi:hypothetical protein
MADIGQEHPASSELIDALHAAFSVEAKSGRYALLLALATLTYSLALKTFGSQIALLVVVWFVSLVSRDVGFYIRSRQVWPIHSKLLDWPEIERLLGEDTQRNSK